MTAIKNTLFVGKVLNYYESAGSTNAIAADLINNEHFTEGVVVCTFNQTAGRGQYGNRWNSEPNKNIALTVVLNPSFLNPREQFHLNKAIALAVHDTISHFTEGYVSVKWPNDIYIHDKKMCGILIQNALTGTHIQSCIVGIGINANQMNFNDLPNATSLAIETGKEFDLWLVVEKLCQCIEQRYLQLKTRQFDKIHSEYLSKMYRWGQDALYQYPNGTYFQGKIVDVSDSGKLLIESKKGLEEFDIKEVKFIV